MNALDDSVSIVIPVYNSEDIINELHQRLTEVLKSLTGDYEIIFVNDLPKTRNSKIMRRMLRAAYLDLDLGDTSSLVNPEVLDEIRKQR